MKKYFQELKRKKMNNKGFTIAELVVAIGIIGVLSVMIVTIMTHSSNSYTAVSAESQVQSEAQLVANAISEYIYDAATAETKNAASIQSIFDKGDGRYLKLKYNLPDDKFKYVYVLRAAADANGIEKDNLYLVESAVLTGAPTESDAPDPDTAALLGQNVTEYRTKVEDSKKQLVVFTLQFDKGGKKYSNDYQVFMRSSAYSKKVVVKDDEKGPYISNVKVTPELVYIDIKDNKIAGYSENNLNYESDGVTVKYDGVKSTPEFTSTVSYGGGITQINHEFSTNLKTTDKFSFTSPAGVPSEDTTFTEQLMVDESHLNTTSLTLEEFNVNAKASSTYTDEEGNTKNLEASNSATVLLRYIRSVSINTSGASNMTSWRSVFNDNPAYEDGNAKPVATVANVDHYATAKSTVVLAANVNASTLTPSGVDWKLEYRSAQHDGSVTDWTEVKDDKIASITSKSISVISIALGENASKSTAYVFRVTATSSFDETKSATYIFGVAPKYKAKSDKGFFSRGFYTDFSEMVTQLADSDSSVGFQAGACLPARDSEQEPQVLYFKIRSIDGSGEHKFSADKVAVKVDENGHFRLFLDYGAFAYSGAQLKNYYGGSLAIHYAIAFKCSCGSIHYLRGKDSAGYTTDAQLRSEFLSAIKMSETQWSAYKAERKGASGNTAGRCICGSNDLEPQVDLTYKPKQVKVSRKNYTSGVIVGVKGIPVMVNVSTDYYNILSPRNGKQFFGIYLGEDMTNGSSAATKNLVASNSESNAYFGVKLTSDYGDTDVFVDQATVSLEPYNTQKQRKYLDKPLILRLAANDYYSIDTSPEEASYVDYQVILANVEGTNIYLPGPGSTGFVNNGETYEYKTGKTFGLNSDGIKVEDMNVTESNGKSVLNYGINKYVYNKTYKYWQQSK